MFDNQAFAHSPALVVKSTLKSADPQEYLVLTPAGRAVWTKDPEAATTFDSMREAARAALRLPGGLRAFGLPKQPEVKGHWLH